MHTCDMPIRLRSCPDPKDRATASKMPMQAASSKAVDTDDKCNLSVASIKDFPWAPSSSSVKRHQKESKDCKKSNNDHQMKLHAQQLKAIQATNSS